MKYLQTMDFIQEPVKYKYKNTSNREWSIFHAHQGMEFLYIHQGNGSVIFDQQIYNVGPGTIIYFQPFQLHGTRMELTGSSAYIRSMLLFEPAVLAPYLEKFPALGNFFYTLWQGSLTRQLFHTPENGKDMEGLLSICYQRLNAAPQRDKLEEAVLCAISFLQYLRTFDSDEGDGRKKDTLRPPHYAEQVMQWIEAHYTEEFKLDRLSEDLHLSGYHLSHLFKKATGASITGYVTARRIRQACWLLKTEVLPVEQIGQRVGLTNGSYFCQLFRKSMGITPLQYRGRQPDALRRAQEDSAGENAFVSKD